MAKEKFLLVDLNEEKTKKISGIISSGTSRKILDYLAEKDDTEQNIAKSLGIAISTVHYHLQKLVESKLVVVEEFHYSKKGREVNHYQLANKYIIIAPRKVSGIKRALNNILPVGLVVLGISAVIKFVSSGFFATAERAAYMVPTAAKQALDEKAAPMMAKSTSGSVAAVSSTPDIALWFLIGAGSALGLYFLYVVVKEKLRKN